MLSLVSLFKYRWYATCRTSDRPLPPGIYAHRAKWCGESWPDGFDTMGVDVAVDEQDDAAAAAAASEAGASVHTTTITPPSLVCFLSVHHITNRKDVFPVGRSSLALSDNVLCEI